VATYDITGANPSLVGVVQVSGELSHEFFQDQLNFAYKLSFKRSFVSNFFL